MRRLPLLSVGALALTVAVAGQAPPPERYDLVLKGGTVVDGAGTAPYRADVAVRGARIAAVGDLAGAPADRVIDVSGLYVAPGFINIHSHAVPAALPTAVNVLLQGVTTEILNPDGGGTPDLAAQRAALERDGLAVNVGAYIGFNGIWSAVVGASDRRPEAGEIERMRAMLAAGLEAGAWGVSAGLDYKPAYFATTEEVVSVVSAARGWGTNFTNHDRLTPEARYSSREGVAETLVIGRRAGLLPVVTHMKVQGHEQGTAPAVLGLLGNARRAGAYAAADVYPYLAGQSGLGALIIPAWAQDGGREAMLARFRNPDERRRIVAEAEEAMTLRFGGPGGVYLPASGRELTDVMAEMGVSGGEAVVRLLEADNMSAILRFGAESDLEAILRHPAASVACDCGASTATRTHPRYYGTYPRVLGRYVRERGVLTWAGAIRKMTLLPAATIGLVDRGAIAAGMFADLAVFDPATVIDRATYDDPARMPEGIRWVLVNGRLAVSAGEATGARAGRTLVRGRHMRSRPTSDGARRMRVDGAVDDRGGRARLTVDVRQGVGDRQARGVVRLRTEDAGTTFEATSLGLLQTATGWASVTGLARVAFAGEASAVAARAFVLVIEDDGGRRTATLEVEGIEPLRMIVR
ncbi:MAG: amidohydrolase family protein [Acidobacteriota bacterium]